MTSQSIPRVDIYQAITNQIITAIEAGTGPVQMPWHRCGAGITRPMNVDSGKAYRGINTVALWAAAINGGYGTGLWGTYRQWQDRGLRRVSASAARSPCPTIILVKNGASRLRQRRP